MKAVIADGVGDGKCALQVEIIFGMNFEFLEMQLLEDDIEILGKEASSAFLVLALAADETMQLINLWIMAMNTQAMGEPTLKLASARSHLFLRLVNLKVVEAQYAMKGLEIALKRRAKSRSDLAILEKISKTWADGMSDVLESEWLGFSKKMRNKMSGHCGTQDVLAWLDSAPRNSDRRFLFHKEYANCSYPATDDLVFGSFLNFHFNRMGGKSSNHEKFDEFLNWLNAASHSVYRTFQLVAVDVFFRILKKEPDKTIQFEIGRELCGSSKTTKLPVFFLRD
ncbi:hypothetical protein Q4544_02625 [Cognatishimia sp. 1_MG-2023]|uniref:hypothetical protein n=1 Tax=Cognatishimia sp. 1_MG-2023 TaxID=3062642 RepID=UPI0026E2E307|nr:hypothetical protein [Cognatishimia sp. 1_MG-2023]MDO6725818.1 hypothetical protein [Cognatishimia sp. 1_MG-2023]